MAFVVAAALIASCVDLPSDQVWTSTHFRYHTRSTEHRACPDLLAHLESHAAVVHAALGIDWDPGEVVDYYKFDGIDDFDAHAGCGDGAACADGPSVRAASAFEAHELVHAYLAKVGKPPWLLLEGAAVAVSCQLAFSYPRPVVDWRTAFDADRDSTLYGAGGWLASRLLATRDPALFLRLYAEVPHDADADAFAAAFARIYGEALDDVWKETVGAEDGSVFCPWECSRPGLPVDGSAVTLEVVCGEGFAARTLDVGADTDWVGTGVGPSSFDVRSCDRVAALGGWAGGSPAFTAFVPLRAGRHFVAYAAPPDGEVATLSLRPADAPVVTTDCAAASVATVAPTASPIQVYFPRSEAVTSIRLSVGATRMMAWAPAWAAEQSALRLCPTCDAAPSACVPLTAETSAVTLGPESVLVAEPGPGALASFRAP